MRLFRWQVLLVIGLILLFVVFNVVHYLVFRDAQHIYLWTMTNLAFLPISVLFVTMIIDQLLREQERRAILQKLNMVIGAFFSEVGVISLIIFSDADPELDKIRNELVIKGDWTDERFSEVSKSLKNYQFDIDIDLIDLENLRTFLMERRNFLLRLLENPNLLEHESFTDLLRAVFHLTEELKSREDLSNLPDTDYTHLSGDIKRAYGLLVTEWLDYMQYLKNNYPYLFSLAMRTNPFDQSASPVVA